MPLGMPFKISPKISAVFFASFFLIFFIDIVCRFFQIPTDIFQDFEMFFFFKTTEFRLFSPGVFSRILQNFILRISRIAFRVSRGICFCVSPKGIFVRFHDMSLTMS